MFYSITGDSAFYLSENSPCIDAGDPASLLDPDGTTADMGCYYYDQNAIPPTLSVILTPFGTPIQIPANGGSFSFNIALSNTGASPETFDIWTMVTLPNGSEYGPIINVPDFNSPANWSGNRDRTQAIPGAAPTGLYTYDAYIGEYPDLVYSEDHFEFEKLVAADGGPMVYNWDNWGEEFGDFGVSSETRIPSEFGLYPAYPNPFNSSTTFRFDLPEAGRISLKVYNVQGREVAKLVDEFKSAGSYNLTFDGSNLSSGIYLTRLETGRHSATQKLLLIK